MRTSYTEKLKDPRWQKKRLQILERDKWACQACFDETKTLHVHHLYYEDGAEPWDYPDYALVTLCADCHEWETEAVRDAVRVLGRAVKMCGATADQIYSLADAFAEWTPPEGASPYRDCAPFGVLRYHITEIMRGDRHDSAEWKEKYFAPIVASGDRLKKPDGAV